jgi:hypothetical protein
MFSTLIENVNEIIDNVEPLIVKEMIREEAQIIDMNTAQLSEGKLDNDTYINPELASDEYAKEKKSNGGKAPIGVPDLHDEGDFYSGFYTKEEKDGLSISSSDPKTDKLEEKYSNIRSPRQGQIFGLTEDNRVILANEIINPIQDEISKLFIRGLA